jgi:hypothetical protein
VRRGRAGQLEIYGINAQTDRLHLLRSSDAVELDVVELSQDFLAMGLEYHAEREMLYACGVRDSETSLFAVEPGTGELSLVAESMLMTTCDNLAARTARVQDLGPPPGRG